MYADCIAQGNAVSWCHFALDVVFRFVVFTSEYIVKWCSCMGTISSLV